MTIGGARVRVKLDEHRIEELLRGSGTGDAATTAAARALGCLGDIGQVSFMPHNGGMLPLPLFRAGGCSAGAGLAARVQQHSVEYRAVGGQNTKATPVSCVQECSAHLLLQPCSNQPTVRNAARQSWLRCSGRNGYCSCFSLAPQCWCDLCTRKAAMLAVTRAHCVQMMGSHSMRWLWRPARSAT